MERGQIIVLNGPSSAGKSTLATAVRARLGPTAAAVSLDRIFAFMHPDVALTWKSFAALSDALFTSARVLAERGFDVIVDTVFERAECLDIMRRAFGDHPYRLVAVSCPLEVLEARELARGNRPAGLARGQYERVLHGATYDMHVNTHALSSDECVERIAALID
jgi:chloramphenicol 3-O phosphotransferase